MSSSIQSNINPSNSGPVGSPSQVSGVHNTQTPGFSPNDSISSIGGQGSAQVLLEGAPKLDTPNSDLIYLYGQVQISEILTKMMKGWSDSIQEMSDRMREYYNSPQYLVQQQLNSPGEIAKDEVKRGVDAINPDLKIATRNASDYQDYLASNPSLQQMTSKDIWEGGLNVALAVNAMLALYTQYSSLASNPNEIDRIDGVRSSSDPSIALTRSAAPDLAAFEGAPSLVPMLVIGAGTSIPVLDAASTGQLQAKLISDAAFSVMNPQGAEALMQTAGWLSALWGIGLTYNTIIQDLKSNETSKNRNAPDRDLDFAVAFGDNLLASLNSPLFEKQLRAIVTATIPENAAAHEERVKQLSSEAKIVLLSLALATILKLELKASFQDKVFEGRVTGDEVLSMLNGDLQATGSDAVKQTKSGLVSSINDLLNGLVPSERQAVLERLGAYFDSNPKVEEMLDSPKRIRDLLTETEGSQIPVNQQKT